MFKDFITKQLTHTYPYFNFNVKIIILLLNYNFSSEDLVTRQYQKQR
jgi:hypothetical protein